MYKIKLFTDTNKYLSMKLEELQKISEEQVNGAKQSFQYWNKGEALAIASKFQDLIKTKGKFLGFIVFDSKGKAIKVWQK